MAESELDSTPRAVEFVERAILAHKNVMRRLETLAPELAEESASWGAAPRAVLDG